MRLSLALAVGAIIAGCGGHEPRPVRPDPRPHAPAPPAAPADRSVRLGDATLAGARGIGVAGDGAWFAYATADETVVVRDTRTFDVIREIKPPDGDDHVCHSIAGSTDGAYVLIVECEQNQLWGTVEIVEVKTGKVAGTIEAHTLNRGPELTPDNKYAWIVDRRGDLFRATILELATGKLVRMDMPDDAKAFALAPDGQTLAVATYSDRPGYHWVETLEVPTSSPITHTRMKGYGASALAFSPDGKRIAGAGFLGGTVTEWDAVSGNELVTRQARTAQLDAVWYGPDGTVYSLDDDDAVIGWEPAGGSRGPYLGPGAIAPSGLGFGAGEMIAVGPGRGGGVVAAWTQATRELVALPGPVAADALAFSPDGLVVHAYRKNVHEAYTLSDRKRSALTHDPAPAGVAVADTMPLPDGDAIVKRAPNAVEITGAHPRPPAALDVGSIAWLVPSPDGKTVAVSDLSRVILFDVATLARRAVLGPGRAIAFSADSTRCALVTDDAGGITLYDVATGTTVGSVVRPGGTAVVAMAFSPDGTMLATSASDGQVILLPLP